MSRHGLFIVFEGIDGAGTTTQCELYARHLRSLRRPVHVTREPSAGPIGSMLRLGLSGRIDLGGAHTMALLFAADRLDHANHEIDPHLRDGTVVICDRYDMSSIAYQTATAPEDEAEAFATWVRTLNRYAPRPDVTIVIDTDPDVAERRRATRHGSPELFEETELQRKLAALYREPERMAPDDRIIRIDGDPAADAVGEAVRAALAPFL